MCGKQAQEEAEQLRQALQTERAVSAEATRISEKAHADSHDLARQLADAQTATAEGAERLEHLTSQLDEAQSARCPSATVQYCPIFTPSLYFKRSYHDSFVRFVLHSNILM